MDEGPLGRERRRVDMGVYAPSGPARGFVAVSQDSAHWWRVHRYRCECCRCAKEGIDRG